MTVVHYVFPLGRETRDGRLTTWIPVAEMISSDLKTLFAKVHTEKYQIVKVEINVHRDSVEAEFQQKVTIKLEKGSDKTTLESPEIDFFIYAAQLRGIVDCEGDPQLVPIKNPDQYWTDLEFLIDDEAHTRLHDARRDNQQGKFPCTERDVHGYAYMIEEFLKRRNNIRNRRFLPLKRDYYHMMAAAFMHSQRTLAIQKKIETSRPAVKKLTDELDQFFVPFRKQGNPIKNFKLYRSYVNFDIAACTTNLSTQLKTIDETIQDGIKKQSIPWHSAVPALASIYHHCIELSNEPINLLRVGLEMTRGVSSPSKRLDLGQNIAILKQDPAHGHMFSCLDLQIRHGHAHCSITFENNQVQILSLQGRKAKVLRSYQPNEFVRMVDVLLHDLFPSLVVIVILHDLAMLDMLLWSKEYRLSMAAIGNC